LDRGERNYLFGTVVLLAIGLVFVLHLCHAVSKSDRLLPGGIGVSSTLDVKLSVIFKNTGLLDILCVVGIPLGSVGIADLVVLRGSKSIRDVRIGADLSYGKLLR
jgi:hypothetical protein